MEHQKTAGPAFLAVGYCQLAAPLPAIYNNSHPNFEERVWDSVLELV